VFNTSWWHSLAYLLITIACVESIASEKKQSKSTGPCDKAMTQLELNMCFGREYKKTDVRLNQLYRKTLDLMQREMDSAREDVYKDTEEIVQTSTANLKAAERAWIQYRDLHCQAAQHEVWGGSMSPMVWAECMSQVTEHRISEMTSAYAWTLKGPRDPSTRP